MSGLVGDAIIVYGESIEQRLVPILHKEHETQPPMVLDSALLRKHGHAKIAEIAESSPITVEFGSVVLKCKTELPFASHVLGNESFAHFLERVFFPLQKLPCDSVGSNIRFAASNSLVTDGSRVRVNEHVEHPGFLWCDVGHVSSTVGNAPIARSVGKMLTRAIEKCTGASRDQFFAICTTPSSPFVLELVRSAFRDATLALFKSVLAFEFGMHSCELARSPHAARVSSFAHREREPVPVGVTTFIMNVSAASQGMLVVHAQDAVLLSQIKAVLASFAAYGPTDDLPPVSHSTFLQPYNNENDGKDMDNIQFLDFMYVDFSDGLHSLETAITAASATSVRSVSFSSSRGLDVDTLCSIVRLPHILLVDVACISIAVVDECFLRLGGDAELKLVDSRVVFGEPYDWVGDAIPIHPRLTAISSKVRRFCGMQSVFGSSAYTLFLREQKAAIHSGMKSITNAQKQ